jgi:hypothetical protein
MRRVRVGMSLIQRNQNIILLDSLHLRKKHLRLIFELVILFNNHFNLILLLLNAFISFLNLLALPLHLVYTLPDLPLESLFLLLGLVIVCQEVPVLRL